MNKVLIIRLLILSILITQLLSSPVSTGKTDYDLNDVWSFTKGVGVTVAVIDTGIDEMYDSSIAFNSLELPNGIDDDGNGYIDDLRGWNVRDDSNSTNDWSFTDHGTKVSSVILSIAPDVLLLPIVFIDSSNSISDYDHLLKLRDALEYALIMEVDVVVMPFNYFILSPTSITDKFQELTDSGIVILSSAGNCSPSNYNCDYIKEPARNANIISVGSISADKKISSFSSRGPQLDFVSYGENINVYSPDGISEANGTSFSVAGLTGLVALLISYYKIQSIPIVYDDIIGAMTKSAKYLGDRELYGHGLPQILFAIKSLTDNISPIISNYENYLVRNVLELSLTIQEDVSITECNYSIKNIQDSNYTQVPSCLSDQNIPLFASNGIIKLDLSFQNVSSFTQINLVLIDSNENELITRFEFTLQLEESNINSSVISSLDSVIINNTDSGTFYIKTGEVISVIPKNSSEVPTASLPYVFILSSLVLISLKRRK